VSEAARGSSGEPTQLAEREALSAVYREYHRFVWHSVRRLGIPDAAAEDAVHEVFMVVARRLPTFEGRASLKTWLFSIAMFVVRSHRRTDRRHRRKTEALAANPSTAADVHARSDAAATLHRLLDVLDDDKRAVFILSELEGMSAPEIAEATDANINTVYARLRTARQRIERAATRLQASEEGRGR
jgi:RNA polymerase sigma-70 factor (ECF subfamily)